MCDKIIQSIPFEKFTKQEIIKHYGKKTKTKDLDVEGVIIKLKLTK